MKFHRPAAVLASAVILASGAAVAVNAATATDPIKLCSNAKTSVVSIPGSGGACARGTTEFFVADNSDVQALAGRMDAAEGLLTSQDTRLGDVETTSTAQANKISALEGQVAALEKAVAAMMPTLTVTATELPPITNAYQVALAGTKLKPGSPVVVHSNGDVEVATTVASDGTAAFTWAPDCYWVPLYVTGTTADGDPITSNTIENGPGCV
jgi:hypothetical protein